MKALVLVFVFVFACGGGDDGAELDASAAELDASTIGHRERGDRRAELDAQAELEDAAQDAAELEAGPMLEDAGSTPPTLTGTWKVTRRALNSCSFYPLNWTAAETWTITSQGGAVVVHGCAAGELSGAATSTGAALLDGPATGALAFVGDRLSGTLELTGRVFSPEGIASTCTSTQTLQGER
jgi:hypothetical protein